MTVSYLIGIDGGGSGTRARVVSADGALVGFGEAGASGLGQGIDIAWQHVREAIIEAFASAEQPMPPFTDCALGLGMAGAHVHERCRAFVRAAPRFARIALDTDAYTTLLGAHGGRPGVVVTAGTGSVGEALHSDGTRVVVGGWGYPVGDEGSGAWLGLQAMRVAHHARDGLVAAGPLARAIWKHAGETRDALLAWCEHAGQNAYAQLAPLVFDAESFDPAAAELLDRATRALEAIAYALDREGRLPLAFAGSVALRLVPRLAPALRARCVQPAGDSPDGALHLIRAALREPRAAAR
ncbi:MAG TPA: BadF/BadG/BcrA/BcrD ATPase family protein [Burkholderiaceae bacterium]|nr:BadF/BadG/BcrA/BcrD ATPase family protein [Burkholderiaceae bacterium]